MPELPEVETVKEVLKKVLLKRTITDVLICYENIIEYPTISEFKEQIIGQVINNIERKGKWLMFDLSHYYLLSHLRMEGKYNIVLKGKTLNKHEHVSFILDNGYELRYMDTRKFGRMHLLKKDEAYLKKPLSDLGLEPFDENLTSEYLKEKYKNKKLPIKTVILDQTIICGIGNIYADEILFMSKINPHKQAHLLDNEETSRIISNAKIVLKKAILLGGTTVRTYSSSTGIHGRFQNELLVHTKTICPICKTNILKEYIGTRGTYYCPNCQKN